MTKTTSNHKSFELFIKEMPKPFTLIFLLLPHLAMSQKFSLLRASEHWALGTLGGVANHRATTAQSPQHINFNYSMDFGLTSVNVGLIGRNFKGWKTKTRRQRTGAIINSVIYLGIGLGSRQLTINYANGFNRN